jgi:hypothetical protein
MTTPSEVVVDAYAHELAAIVKMGEMRGAGGRADRGGLKVSRAEIIMKIFGFDGPTLHDHIFDAGGSIGSASAPIQ